MLPPFGAKLGAKTKEELEKLGVEVLLGAMVTDVDERGIEVQYKDGRTERIDAVTKIWAAGVQANPLGRTLAEQTGAPLDRAGRIGVNPDLTLPGHPEVFVVGDMIALDNLPGVAQVAIQGAKYAAKEIDGRLEGKPPQQPFKYFDKGSMAIISRFRAVAMIGKLRLTGFIAWLMWLARAPRSTSPASRTGSPRCCTGRSRSSAAAAPSAPPPSSRSSRGPRSQRLKRGAADLVSDTGRVRRARRRSSRSPGAPSSRPGRCEEARLTDAGERGVRADHADRAAGRWAQSTRW